MAEADRTALTPPQRFALGLSRARRLSVPVDIEAIIAEYSDVEYDVFPPGVDCDAVVIRKDGRRPCVVISQEKHENRQRFTLAHELGHIVLPWQVGTFICHSRISYRASDELIRAIEMDAHQFASELLIPRAWVRNELPLRDVKPSKLAEALVDVASRAKVSVIAAALSAAPCLPAETLLVLTQSDIVTYAITGPGSKCKVPEKDSRFVAADYKAMGVALGSRAYPNKDSTKTLHVAHFEPTEAGGEGGATATSREVLSAILVDLGAVGDERLRLQRLIAGVVGYANNLASDEHPLAMLRQRFLGRTELREVVTHPRFGEFLVTKADELRDPERRPRKR